MKRCSNCQKHFNPINTREKYCDRCKGKGDRGIRFYHANKGDAINIGIKVSSLNKRSTLLRKVVQNGSEETRTA